MFIFSFQQIAQATRDLKPTKRHVIGIISRFYDPLGVLAPITIKLKMFFQELCQSKVEWDEELFVIAKTKVSPINKQSISRLELLSALILARLFSTVTKALNETLKLSDPICWTDSKVSLHWIQGETQEWKQFVENRVKEIRKLVPIKY